VYVMSLPPPIFDGFFRNPFGSEMKPIGGMGGEGGVLENIQQQVADNGEALQALQGGIGGLPNTPFQPAINQPIAPVQQPTVNQPIAYENPGALLDLLDFNPPTSVIDAGKDSQAQLRAEYDKAVADAKRQRAEGMLGRVMLPGEMSFEEFARMQLNPGPKKADLFNIAQVEQNPGMDYSQFTPTIGNLYDDTSTGPPQILSDTPRSYGVQLQDFGNRGYTGGGTPPVFSDSVNVNQNPTPSMDQLFGRAFAGKPI